MTRYRCAFVLLLALIPVDGAAQQAPPDKFDVLAQRWRAILADVVREEGLETIDANGASVTLVKATRLRAPAIRGLDAAMADARNAEAVSRAYEEAVSRLLRDPQLAALFFTADPSIVDHASTLADQTWVADLASAATKESGAKALNASLTNAAAPRAAERSGLTDLVALALDSQSIVGADKTAVTISLNALAAFGLSDDRRSAQALYREHALLRRIGGSFSFGAKLPEGELTGLTGIPSAETLFDVIGWDAKVRLYGDRDPRATRWYALMLGYLGGLGEIEANVLASVPAGDLQAVRAILANRVQRSVTAAKEQLQKSAQVSFKAAGQHVTNEQGKNKYTFAVLGDKGFASADITANVAYAIVDDVTLAPGSVYTLKTWTAAFGFNQRVAEGLLEEGRSVELSLNANFELPVSTEGLPVERKRTTRIVGAVSIPWGASASIPVSITYANDPNKLSDQKYVTGHVGVTWDFGALKSLFQPRTTR